VFCFLIYLIPASCCHLVTKASASTIGLAGALPIALEANPTDSFNEDFLGAALIDSDKVLKVFSTSLTDVDLSNALITFVFL